ncbi:hypothetical protein QAD02_024113 [Eretmocerus hayati]|uniref:Uncharacterized protein n=1 Tax=Eretmocerus hayati TaxID=131215 RepID=A0ACC2PZE1_9HYME|nr:hypothetical protein QAD02_024113 [Eretmocerus hayati]
MPLDSVTVSTEKAIGTSSATYYLPECMYNKLVTPNLLPLRAFVHLRVDVEIKVIVNANKFHTGKVIVSSKYDSFQADSVCDGYQSALARNHVIIDLTANNTGVLNVPFRFHRPWVRGLKTTDGVRAGKYASVYLQVLSPLKTDPNGPSEIDLRVLYRFKNMEFTGMAPQATVQMNTESIIEGALVGGLKGALQGIESKIDQLGPSRNQDKPASHNTTIVVPKPRWNFTSGKGTTAVTSMRVNPQTATNFKVIDVPRDEPRSFYELARVWGIMKSFTWSREAKIGEELIDMIVDPTLRSYDQEYTGELTPLEYTMGAFAFWNGTIEFRFDFVSLKANANQLLISNQLDDFPSEGYTISDIKTGVLKDSYSVDTASGKKTKYYNKSKRHTGINNEMPAKDWKSGLAKVQMDKVHEDQDSTADFRSGFCVLPVQTLDCHMDFKDLNDENRYTAPGSSLGLEITYESGELWAG